MRPPTMNARDKSSGSSAGLSLIEVMVSAAVVAIVAAIAVTGSLAARRAAVARAGAEQVAAFLRQTAGFALNGVKAPGCDLADPTNVPRCSQYEVRVSQGSSTYDRSAVGGGAPDVQALPVGVRFGDDRAVSFRYTPPTLTTTRASILVRHVSGSPVWRICVNTLGRIDLRPDACP